MSLPWVKQLHAVMESADPINMKAAKALALLKENGLAYEATVRPKDVLVHTSNRGGAMVNGYDVASKGQAISELGWDLQKVRQSVAMELPVDQAKRQTIVKANLTLAEQSDGILCRPFGQERFCSLSSSHTTCFLRSLEAGCEVMPGKASVEQLVAKGDDLGNMMFQGWQWTIISCKVDEEVPNLATMLQQAGIQQPLVYTNKFSCFPQSLGVLGCIASHTSMCTYSIKAVSLFIYWHFVL